MEKQHDKILELNGLGLQGTRCVVFIWFPGGKSGSILHQRRWNVFSLQHGGLLLWFHDVPGSLVVRVAHSVWVCRRLVLRFDMSTVRSHQTAWLYRTFPRTYRHPGVRQDLLCSETAVHVHLQHLADQHLGGVGGGVVVRLDCATFEDLQSEYLRW